MLTTQTQVEYARLELQRDPSFAIFCHEKLATLRLRYALPDDVTSCLLFEVVPGLPLARLLIEAFEKQLGSSRERWQRVASLP